MVRCIESRREDVGVEPEEFRIVLISLMESRPISEGAAWCSSAGLWFEDMWRADARPWTILVVCSA
jgi:hypothetical protein